jgi:hypothetical protein
MSDGYNFDGIVRSGWRHNVQKQIVFWTKIPQTTHKRVYTIFFLIHVLADNSMVL